MSFEEQIAQKAASLQTLKETLEKDVKLRPGLSLVTRKSHGSEQFYKVENGKEHYIGDKELIADLVRKEYAKKTLPLIRKSAKLLTKLDKMRFLDAIEKIRFKIRKSKLQFLPWEAWPREEYTAAWLAQEFKPNSYENKDPLRTRRGEFVRSKSELIIADALFSRGIPYLYEKPLRLGKATVYPDFTILNPRTREELYWEHQGGMGDDGYAASAVKKQEQYIKNGFFPGINLIITQECKSTPLSTEVVELLIEHFLE